MLVAIPLCLIVVTPFCSIVAPVVEDAESFSGYLIMLGVVTEHGMFMNEALASRINQRKDGGGDDQNPSPDLT